MPGKNILNFLNNEETIQSDDPLDTYADSLLDALQNGATLKDVYAVPNDTIQDLYKLAFDFYHHGKLDDAESIFRLLCIYDFYNPEYPMGLAAVYQLKKNYAKAIELYALAYSLSNEDFRPMFYAGQCNLMLRQGVQARECFEIVINRCKDTVLNEKAQSYLSALDIISSDNADASE